MRKLLIISALLVLHLASFAQWNTDRILAIGRNALYFEDYVLSIQYFNQVIRIRPFLAEPYLYRGIAKLQLGDFEGGELDVSEAITRNPFLPEAFYARGFSRMRLGKYELAAQDFEKAIEFSPSSRHLLLSRVEALERMGDYKSALKDINALQKMNPRSVEVSFDKGRILLALNDTLAAEQTFNQVIQTDSTNSSGWSARALVRLQRNNYEGAYYDYSKAISLKSNYFGDYINRGIINVEYKRYMEALSDYDQAVKLQLDSKLAYFNRGKLRANLGDDNNALSDFKKVLEFDSTSMEARYDKALQEHKLRNYRNAISDYKIIIEKYPYFLPAYWNMAEAYTSLNNTKEAFRIRQKASDLEKNKAAIMEKMKNTPEAKNMIAKEAPKTNSTKKTSVFNRYATQNIEENAYESKYADDKRGTVQKKFVDVMNEKNFVLTYYSKKDDLRRTNLYQIQVDQYNRLRKLRADLKITSNEIALTNDLINKHFETIDEVSSNITQNDQNPDLYFQRAIEFALVQDFSSAVEDLNKAISLRSDFVLAYFTRANIRHKYIEYLKNSVRESASTVVDTDKKTISENEYKFEVEMVMRDFDKVIELTPDFSFAYYNKANILSSQKDFRSAIYNYSRAIDADSDFAEAYFNRGLTYLFIGEEAKGQADLSKAGELGIVGAYNLIQRFK